MNFGLLLGKVIKFQAKGRVTVMSYSIRSFIFCYVVGFDRIVKQICGNEMPGGCHVNTSDL